MEDILEAKQNLILELLVMLIRNFYSPSLCSFSCLTSMNDLIIPTDFCLCCLAFYKGQVCFFFFFGRELDFLNVFFMAPNRRGTNIVYPEAPFSIEGMTSFWVSEYFLIDAFSCVSIANNLFINHVV